MRSSAMENKRHMAARDSTPLAHTILNVARSRKMMSNVILSTPAFLLRMVLARSPRRAVLLAGLVMALTCNIDHMCSEQLHGVFHAQRVIDRPAIGRACRQYLVQNEGDTAGRPFHIGQPRVKHLPRCRHAEL